MHFFFQDNELIDMNQATLHYASTRVLDENTCTAHFRGNKELASLIESSMLCTLKPGNLNDKGELILRSPPIAQGCVTEAARLKGAVGRMVSRIVHFFLCFLIQPLPNFVRGAIVIWCYRLEVLR